LRYNPVVRDNLGAAESAKGVEGNFTQEITKAAGDTGDNLKDLGFRGFKERVEVSLTPKDYRYIESVPFSDRRPAYRAEEPLCAKGTREESRIPIAFTPEKRIAID
jgi:hypothetical protein